MINEMLHVQFPSRTLKRRHTSHMRKPPPWWQIVSLPAAIASSVHIQAVPPVSAHLRTCLMCRYCRLMGLNTALAEPSVWQPMLQGGAVLVSWDPVTNSSILSFPVGNQHLRVATITHARTSMHSGVLIGVTQSRAADHSVMCKLHLQSHSPARPSFNSTTVGFSPVSVQVRLISPPCRPACM